MAQSLRSCLVSLSPFNRTSVFRLEVPARESHLSPLFPCFLLSLLLLNQKNTLLKLLLTTLLEATQQPHSFGMREWSGLLLPILRPLSVRELCSYTFWHATGTFHGSRQGIDPCLVRVGLGQVICLLNGMLLDRTQAVALHVFGFTWLPVHLPFRTAWLFKCRVGNGLKSVFNETQRFFLNAC